MSDKEEDKEEQKLEQKVKNVKKPNAWIDHVKKVAEDKNISYREALKIAGQTYKK
jgi:hypothetical protein